MRQADTEIETFRTILLNWKRLSPGDISILQMMLDKPDATAATTEGCANFVLWTSLERLGWARRVRLPLPIEPPAGPPAFFVLTGKGRHRLPGFLVHYELKPGTFYVDRKRPLPDSAWLDRALRSAGLEYVAGQSYAGFTRGAGERLRALNMTSVALALAAFAYDARETVRELVAAQRDGRHEEAEKLWLGLRARVRMNLAFRQSGLTPPFPDLHELGARLGVGLGGELQAWLNAPTLSFPEAAAWVAEHGPGIERLCAHVTERTKRPDPQGRGAAGTLRTR